MRSLQRARVIEFGLRPRQRWLLASMLVSCVLAAPALFAQEFRAFQAIAAPAPVPKGAKIRDPATPINPEIARRAVEDVLEAWNKGDLNATLADEFVDRSRLSDAVQTEVPRDASIRIQSVQGIQTLQQYEQPAANGNTQIVSTVSVTANTQIEFNDADNGFRRLEGVNEYVLRVTEEIQP